jgi:hypothetical protein
MNATKGLLGEGILTSSVTQGLFESANRPWVALTAHRVGAQGIDGLFVRTGRDGSPSQLLVADAKFGSSQLSMTRSGRQMSASWVRPRLRLTGRNYVAAADALRDGRPLTVEAVMKVGLPGGTATVVRFDREGTAIIGLADRRTVEQQLRRTGAFLIDAANGRVAYQARVHTFDMRDGEHVIKIQRLNRATGRAVGSPKTIRRRWSQLDSRVRQLVRDEVLSALAASGYPPEDLAALTKRACRDPKFFHGLRRQARSRWLTGVDSGMAKAVGVSTVLAAAFEVSVGLAEGHIDLRRVLQTGALAAGAAASGYWVTTQVESLMPTTALGRALSRALPLRGAGGSIAAGYAGLAAGIAVGALTAVAAYGFGLVDGRGVKLMAASSVSGSLAAVAVQSGAMAVAGYGTAGTGAAISGLSGAAATSAKLAWLGGTVAGGGAILTGGALAAGAAVAVGVSFVVSKLEEAEKRRLVEGHLELVHRKLNNMTAAR